MRTALAVTVVGTGDATSRLCPGQVVAVDGAAGTVIPVEPPADEE
jgi:hypothetical protein